MCRGVASELDELRAHLINASDCVTAYDSRTGMLEIVSWYLSDPVTYLKSGKDTVECLISYNKN